MSARTVLRALLWAGVAVGVSACGGDMSDLEAYALEVKSRKSRAIDPIPQPKPYEPFAYEPGSRRSPFTPFLQAREQLARARSGGNCEGPDTSRPPEPLEEYAIDSLRMVGTITMQKRAYALIKAPDAVVHRASVGDHLGKNFGRITSITETDVTVMEIIPDGLGCFTQRPATLALVQ